MFLAQAIDQFEYSCENWYLTPHIKQVLLGSSMSHPFVFSEVEEEVNVSKSNFHHLIPHGKLHSFFFNLGSCTI